MSHVDYLSLFEAFGDFFNIFFVFIKLTEIWQVDDVTPAADWWSVGALLYEIITGQV